MKKPSAAEIPTATGDDGGSTAPDATKAAQMPRVQQVLDLADQLEAEERRIKLAIISLARRRDAAGIRALVERWIEGPVTEVLQSVSEAEK